jgi:conjugal transfer ATP-binding protein TraC
MANADLSALMQKGSKAIRPDAPGEAAIKRNEAQSLTARESFSSLFTYRFFDPIHNICFLDDGASPAIGFTLGMSPLASAGVDTESQFEAIFTKLPPDSIIQFGKLVTPQVEGFLNTWANARLAKNTNPLLRQIALRRLDFMLATASGPSMLPHTRLHPRMMQWYVSVRLPYKGNLNDAAELNSFVRQALDIRGDIQGTLKSGMMESVVLDESELKFLLRELANPHVA